MTVISFFQLCILIILVLFILFNVYKKRTKDKYKGAYFLRTKNDQLKTIIEYIGDDKKQKIVDLGSGDGKVLMKLAKNGYEVTGFEISIFLYLISLIKKSLSKYSSNIKVFNKNFWEEDLFKYDVVILYGIGYMMKDVLDKLQRELKKDSKIISVRFKFENISPNKEESGVYLYTL